MRTTSDNVEVVQQSSVVVVAVKPDVVPAVLRQVAPVTTSDHLFVSIAAGVTTKAIEKVCIGDLILRRRVRFTQH